MITDNQLYSLALFLGSTAMVLIVMYHWLQINSDEPSSKIILEGNGNTVPEKTKKGKVAS
jgi:oligosaccharyl transferase complex subunit OST4